MTVLSVLNHDKCKPTKEAWQYDSRSVYICEHGKMWRVYTDIVLGRSGLPNGEVFYSWVRKRTRLHLSKKIIVHASTPAPGSPFPTYNPERKVL